MIFACLVINNFIWYLYDLEGGYLVRRMYKLLHIFIIFIFVIIVLNAPDNDVIINRLHLKGLISKNDKIDIDNLLKEKKYKENGKEHTALFVDILSKNLSLNIDELIDEVLKEKLDLRTPNRCIEANTFVVPCIQRLNDSQYSTMRFDRSLNLNNTFFSKMYNEVAQLFSFPENMFLQEGFDKQAAVFSQDEEIISIREIVSNAQKKNILIKNMPLKDLIAKNDINKTGLFNNSNYIEKESIFLYRNTLLKKSSLNINDLIEEKLKRNPTICETKASIDKIAIEIPNVQMFDDFQFSVMRPDNSLTPNNAFLSKVLNEESQLFPLLEKHRLPEKIDKQIPELSQKEDIITKQKLVSNAQKKDLIVDNLHLKDLITKNKIINKRKLLKDNDCKNNKKEHALSYVDALLKKPSLKIDDLIEDVLKRNPDLKATKRRIEANALVVPRVQILDDPQFTARRHDSPLRSNSAFFSKMRYELSQLFPFPGKLRLKGKIAEQMLKFAQNEEITTMRELVLQTKRLYYQLYLNYAALRINKQNQEIISRFIEDTLALYKTGEEKYDEVLKAQIELQLLKKELLDLLS
ncbi:MAG: hypothetical protein KR126chlam6_00468, partial [Candidatus Anoxychlamydiales bacterium]|nr:hypothetical protein [Candidatus Anoxychlamydiales bacterium]